MGEYIPLEDMDDWDSGGVDDGRKEEETNFGGLPDGFVDGGPIGAGPQNVIHAGVISDLSIAERRKRNMVYWDVKDFFGDVLDLEAETRDPLFIDWLVDRRGLKIRRS